jgi:hypothetical protein
VDAELAADPVRDSHPHRGKRNRHDTAILMGNYAQLLMTDNEERAAAREVNRKKNSPAKSLQEKEQNDR